MVRQICLLLGVFLLEHATVSPTNGEWTEEVLMAYPGFCEYQIVLWVGCWFRSCFPTTGKSTRSTLLKLSLEHSLAQTFLISDRTIFFLFLFYCFFFLSNADPPKTSAMLPRSLNPDEDGKMLQVRVHSFKTSLFGHDLSHFAIDRYAVRLAQMSSTTPFDRCTGTFRRQLGKLGVV